MINDRAYFMRRAAQELAAANNAATDEARQVHLELARQYRDRTLGDHAQEDAAATA